MTKLRVVLKNIYANIALWREKNEKILIRKGISDLKPYVPGKLIEDVKTELGLKEVIKLASNNT